MSEVFDLAFDTSSAVTILPDPGMARQDKIIESVHRTPTGARYSYKWGDYYAVKIPVSFVSSGDAAIVNSWWVSRAPLVFRQYDSTSGSGAADVRSVMITNKKLPISKFEAPNLSELKGVIELEVY
jgi:hypothetical protein